MGHVKGQFFLIGAVLVCVLLYGGTAAFSAVSGGQSDDMAALSENMEAEMPHALNIGANASGAAGTLIAFANFSRSAASSRGIDMEAVFVVFESSQSGIQATAGNAAAQEASVGINVSGSYVLLTVPAGETNATAFAAGGDTFSASVETDMDAYSATIPANKTSLYCALTLSRGDTVIGKQILA